MFGWLNSFLNWTFSGLNDLKNWIIKTFQAVVNQLTGLIDDAWKGIRAAWNEAVSLYNTLVKYIGQLYTMIRSVVDNVVRDIESWVSGLVNTIHGWIDGIIRWVTGLLDSLGKWVLSQLTSLGRWILDNIWNPIWRVLSSAVGWIATYGQFVYYMLTHPEQLAKTIGTYILHEFFNLGHKYSRVIGRWVMHSMLSAAHEVGSLIEDIISSLI